MENIPVLVEMVDEAGDAVVKMVAVIDEGGNAVVVVDGTADSAFYREWLRN